MGTLSNILLYHVASGEILSTQLTDGMEIPTLLDNATVVVDLSRAGSVLMGGSTVTTPDVLASNGVIHIINEVLVPPGVDVGAYLETCPPASNAPEVDEDESESEEDDDESGGIDDFLGGIVGDVDNGG